MAVLGSLFDLCEGCEEVEAAQFGVEQAAGFEEGLGWGRVGFEALETGVEVDHAAFVEEMGG